MADAVRLFMGEGDVTDTIPSHKTEIKSFKEDYPFYSYDYTNF